MSIQLRGLGRERIRRGITQSKLAELAATPHSYVCELESGKRRAGPEIVRRLSAALASVPVIEGADALLGEVAS